MKKIGFSLYSPEELRFILDNKSPFDLIQVPFNIFDKKFLPYMKELHEKGVEIHVRSTFLQGLFFMDRNVLPEKLQPLRKYLLQLDEFSSKSGLSISEIALNYNLQNPYIDGVLIGDGCALSVVETVVACHCILQWAVIRITAHQQQDSRPNDISNDFLQLSTLNFSIFNFQFSTHQISFST